MRWGVRIVVILVCCFLLAGCLGLGYAVYARYQGNDYVVRLTTAFNAAALLNGEETYTDPDMAIIASYEGRRYVVTPENYKALVSLLRKFNVMPPFRRVGKDAPLAISICDSAGLWIEPDNDSADGALVRFESADGKRFTMHVRGGNIWAQIIEYATTGHSDRRNLELTD